MTLSFDEGQDDDKYLDIGNTGLTHVTRVWGGSETDGGTSKSDCLSDTDTVYYKLY